MQDHANGLRVEVASDWETLSTTPRPDDAGLDAFVCQIVDDWRQAPLSGRFGRLVEFAEKVTRSPAACTESDIAELRAADWSDEAIHDAVQVIAYFNYINRVAEGLGVAPEESLPLWGAGRPR